MDIIISFCKELYFVYSQGSFSISGYIESTHFFRFLVDL